MNADKIIDDMKKSLGVTDPTPLSETKKMMMSLDPVSRHIVGFAALIKTIINRGSKLNDEQQMDIIESAIRFYRGTVLLQTLEVILPMVTDMVDKIKDIDNPTPLESEVASLANALVTFSLQIHQDTESDRQKLRNRMVMLDIPSDKNTENS